MPSMSDTSYNQLTLLFTIKEKNEQFAKFILKDEFFAFRCLCALLAVLQIGMILVDLNRVTFATNIVIFRAIDILIIATSAITTYIIDFKSSRLIQLFSSCVFLMHLSTLVFIDYTSPIPSFFLSNAFITSIYLIAIVGGIRFYQMVLFVVLVAYCYIHYIFNYSPHQEVLEPQNVNIVVNLLGALFINYLTERRKIFTFISKTNLENNIIETKKISKTKDELLNLVAIDLKKPVVDLENTLNRLKNEESLPITLKPQVNSISNNLSNVSHLLLNLSQWSQAELDQVELTKETFNINEIFYNVKPLFDEVIMENNITTVLPEKAKNHYITADREMITIVIRNLFKNALKFSSHYGVVRISTTSNESFTTVSINNDGPGIAQQEIDKIFSLNANTVKDALNRGRSGLSLVVSKSFVEMNNGKIWVESIENDGTTFYIQFKSAF